MSANTVGQALSATRHGEAHLTYGVTGHQDLPTEAKVLAQTVFQTLFGRDSDLVGVSSLAAGADQLFAAEILRAGGRLEVVIPCAGYESTFGPQEIGLYRDLLDRAADVSALPFPQPSEAAYMAAGIAIVERSEVLVAVWDGQVARGLGGTADIVRYAESRGRRIEVAWPDGLAR
jgi:hypothetical protein